MLTVAFTLSIKSDTFPLKWRQEAQSYLRKRCCCAALGYGLPSACGTGDLWLPSLSARPTHRWPHRLLHAKPSDAGSSTARSGRRGGKEKGEERQNAQRKLQFFTEEKNDFRQQKRKKPFSSQRTPENVCQLLSSDKQTLKQQNSCSSNSRMVASNKWFRRDDFNPGRFTFRRRGPPRRGS